MITWHRTRKKLGDQELEDQTLERNQCRSIFQAIRTESDCGTTEKEEDKEE